GAVGLAVVQLARSAGAEVFATASPAKWSALRARGVRHVMSSRSLEFEGEVMQLTDGQGVDVVVNSLGGEFIPRSLALLRPGGRFVELGRRDGWDAERAERVRPGVRYQRLDLATWARTAPDQLIASLRGIVGAAAAG